MNPAELAKKVLNTGIEALPEAVAEKLGHGDIKHPLPKHQAFPGITESMEPQPVYVDESYKGSEKLRDKVAIITGADSGIGKSVAIYFAKEGCTGIMMARLAKKEDHDAQDTIAQVEAEGGRCLDLIADVSDPEACKRIVSTTIEKFNRLDIIVHNAGTQVFHPSISDSTNEEIDRTFAVNTCAHFYLTQAAMPYLKQGSSILITSSLAGCVGNPCLVDYSASKGANQSFVKSLSLQLADKGVRVNSVAPGTIYTPFIPATFPRAYIKEWSNFSPMKRVGQPCEVAPCYVFLASEDASYFTGQTLHPNGGLYAGS